MLSICECLQEFDAIYVIECDAVCKGLLRGEVQIFETFVVGKGAQDAKDPPDSDDVTCRVIVPRGQLHIEKPETYRREVSCQKGQGPQSHGKSGGTGPIPLACAAGKCYYP